MNRVIWSLGNLVIGFRLAPSNYSITRSLDYSIPLSLLRLLVRRVLSAEAAELAELQPLGRFLFVLRRAVVATFADATCQLDDVSHNCIPVSFQFPVPSSKFGCSLALRTQL